MKRDFIWIVIVLLALFFNPVMCDRYQATNIGGKILVLDKTTGECWISLKDKNYFLNTSEMEMVPIRYESGAQWSFNEYTPEETRDDRNIGWRTWLRKKLSKKKPTAFELQHKEEQPDLK